MIKNIVFDYGRVLAYPKSGNWYMSQETPRILGVKLVQELISDQQLLADVFKDAHRFLDENHLLHTEAEEQRQFTVFYKRILASFGVADDGDILASQLADDMVYRDDKILFYEDVPHELALLSKTYRLAVLSDNWPSARRVLKNAGLLPYLDGVILSCDYGETKENTRLFEIAIEKLNLKPDETLFVDDSIGNLDNAKLVGFLPVLMDRDSTCPECGYPVIHHLGELHGIISGMIPIFSPF